jgi:peptidoglycan hydrolase-like protein with peptidoglycan-binding domain
MKRPLLFLVATLCTAGLVRADQTVRSLQQTLKDRGFYYGTVTGEKSAETTAAIRRYQIRNGLQVSGEINDETLRSLNSSSNSMATASRSKPKSAATQLNGTPSDTSSALSQSSLPPTVSQPDRGLETNPSYAASFYQAAPVPINRRMIAGAQYALMSRGYYRGRVDGKYGSQTAFAVHAFQSRAGLPPTGRLDMQTLNALELSDTDFAYAVPASRVYETRIPVGKFKHGKWKVKWKSYERTWDNDDRDEDRQANREYGWQSQY